MLTMNLPPPLKGKENTELAQRMAEGDEEAREKLINGNLRLVSYIANKFQNTGIDTDDLFSIGLIGIIKAVDSFKVDKNIQFATYASRCIENEILMSLRRTKKIKEETSIHDVVYTDKDGSELTLLDLIGDERERVDYNLFEMREVAAALEHLPEKQRTIIDMRYIKGMTQLETGEALGISQSYVSRIAKKGLKKIRNVIEGVGFIPKSYEKTKSKKMKIEEDESMRRQAAKGDREKAQQLLTKTIMTYKEVSDATGVPLGTVSIIALEVRPEPVRKALASKDPIKKARMLHEAGYHKEAEAILAEYNLSLTEEQKKAEIVVEKPVAPVAPTTTTTIAQAVDTFRQEVEEEVEKKMADTSAAKQTSGTIKKMISFKYEASGEKIKADEFITELSELVNTLQASKNEFVTFTINVEAE